MRRFVLLGIAVASLASVPYSAAQCYFAATMCNTTGGTYFPSGQSMQSLCGHGVITAYGELCAGSPLAASSASGTAVTTTVRVVCLVNGTWEYTLNCGTKYIATQPNGSFSTPVGPCGDHAAASGC